jgi:hypothetical protein
MIAKAQMTMKIITLVVELKVTQTQMIQTIQTMMAQIVILVVELER